jgi:hypothetical protein
MKVHLPQVPRFLETSDTQVVEETKSSVEPVVEEDLNFQEDLRQEIVVPRAREIQKDTSDNSLDWKSLLKSNQINEDIIIKQQQLGQLNDMLTLNAPETKWTTIWFGSPILSLSLLANAFHVLKTLINSSQWHQPERAEILFNRWNNVSSIRINWKKTDLPPLFIEDNDDLEVLINQHSGFETIQLFEANSNHKTGKDQ